MTCHEVSSMLSLLIDGRLDSWQQQAVQSHLEKCAACREALKDLKEGSGCLRSVDTLAFGREFNEILSYKVDRESRRLRKILLYTRYAWAAVWLLSLGIGGFLGYTFSPHKQQAVSAAGRPMPPAEVREDDSETSVDRSGREEARQSGIPLQLAENTSLDQRLLRLQKFHLANRNAIRVAEVEEMERHIRAFNQVMQHRMDPGMHGLLNNLCISMEVFLDGVKHDFELKHAREVPLQGRHRENWNRIVKHLSRLESMDGDRNPFRMHFLVRMRAPELEQTVQDLLRLYGTMNIKVEKQEDTIKRVSIPIAVLEETPEYAPKIAELRRKYPGVIYVSDGK